MSSLIVNAFSHQHEIPKDGVDNAVIYVNGFYIYRNGKWNKFSQEDLVIKDVEHELFGRLVYRQHHWHQATQK